MGMSAAHGTGVRGVTSRAEIDILLILIPFYHIPRPGQKEPALPVVTAGHRTLAEGMAGEAAHSLAHRR